MSQLSDQPLHNEALTSTKPSQSKRVRLAPRQRIFADEWLRTFNATKAAQTAGYSEKTADVQGSRLLRNVKVEAFIEAKLRELQIAPDEILARFSAQARANLTECIGPDGKIDPDKVKALGSLVKSYREPTAKGGAQVELYDAQRALELLGKAHGLFKDEEKPGDVITIVLNARDV
ncbi:MAG TPA: terminase small subunit [Verrucomicrobiae bacterium]|nr:terminase small subunit [Verrucomicrobiae bacterium]